VLLCTTGPHRTCDLCRRLRVKGTPPQQGRRTDIEKKELLAIIERKDESSGDGVHVSASLPRRGEVPVRDSSDHQTMDTLDVYCQGKRILWLIGDTNSLECKEISTWLNMDKVGVSTYIICTSVSKLPSSANGTICIFSLRRTKTKDYSWHLAVVESFSYLNEDGTDIVHLLEWSGPVTS